MIKLLFIYGTRPEAIKLAPLIYGSRTSKDIETIVCTTAQHRDMVDQIESLLNLRPDVDLNLMQANQSLSDLTSRAIEALSKVIQKAQPDAVVVQGDTTTAMAGALCAFYERVPVAHVEAGLRTGDIYAPFPEEVNRLLISKIARWHFAPTRRAEGNLMLEGIAREAVYVTGNTAIDTLQYVGERLTDNSNPLPNANHADGKPSTKLEERLILVTAHRRESFAQDFPSICRALMRVVDEHENLRIIYPVHPNPNVVRQVDKLLSHPRINLIKPLRYDQLIYLLQRVWLVITDSGGIQEEAPSLGKPVLVLREVTERVEAIEAGTAKLVGTNTEQIVQAVRELMNDPSLYRKMGTAKNPFGDGKAAIRILERLYRDLVIPEQHHAHTV